MPAADPTTQDQPESPGSDDPDSRCTSAPDDAVPAAPIRIDCINNTGQPDPAPQGWLAEQLSRAAELAEVRSAVLALVIVSDEEMAQLHEQYTGVSGTTDVLTFDLREPAQADPSAGQTRPSQHTVAEGDIVICLDEARRQADHRGHPVHYELLLYAIHGLLHLIGEDDHDESAYQRMHAREDALLEQLGIGSIFNPKPQPPETSP